MRRPLLLLPCLSLLLPCLASAQATPTTTMYGHKGQLIVSGASRLTLGGAHFAHRIPLSVLPKNRFEMSLSPSAGVFLTQHFALGLAGSLEVARADRQTAWGVSVGPQALGYVPLGGRLGLMPLLAVLYGHSRNDERVALTMQARGLLHVSPGFSLAAGPQVTQDLWRRGAKLRITDYDFVVSFIGWI